MPPSVIAFAVFAGIVGYIYTWRKQRNETLDGQVLVQLKKAGSDLSKVHNCQLFFVAPSQDAATRLIEALSEIEISAKVSEFQQGTEVGVSAELNLVPEFKVMAKLRQRVSTIAAEMGAEYDGWGSEVVP